MILYSRFSIKLSLINKKYNSNACHLLKKKSIQKQNIIKQNDR